MSIRSGAFSLTIAVLLVGSGCGGNGEPASGSAVIVGRVTSAGTAGKDATLGQTICPDVVVTLNDAAVNIVLDDDCTFLIDDVQPSARVVLDVELPGLGVSGALELTNIVEAELIEILVETGDDSLTLSIVRRVTPDPVAGLPMVVSGNNVTIFLGEGIYNQSLTVDGNNFTLVGEAGEDCDDQGWTVITGEVLVLKNNATSGTSASRERLKSRATTPPSSTPAWTASS